MNNRIRAVLTALMALAIAVSVAACGSSSSGGGSSSGSGGSSGGGKLIKKNSANASKSITIGSKNFPEQFVLGNIYSEALSAAGYKVKKQLNLGSETVAYKALTGGQIDAYPEYTGTALTAFFKEKATDVPKDPNGAFNDLKQKLAAKGITASPHTPFENTYRMGMTKAEAKKVGNPTKISDLSGKSQNLKVNGYPECEQRIDCLLGVEKTYGLKFKAFVASQDPYSTLDKGDADVAFVFTTDAALSTGKYQVLDDDKHLFPPYNITFMVNTKKLKELGPDAAKVIADVQKPLTNEVMQELNSRVVLDKKDPAVVAKEYLQESGFIPKG
ncbi:MAG: osmoprotectant transport system substrate-binding protein opuBD [Thermoleophilaceae bacterium]|nr:osmoprotectant transport system substrate-binding protein opuBD [Thermoleophilaceae bacterium]